MVVLLSALVLAAITARDAAALEQAEIDAIVACVFQPTGAPCAPHNWNDDPVVNAADVPAYVRFIPVQVEDTPDAVTLRSDAAMVRVDKATAGLTVADAAGVPLTTAAAPTLQLGDTAQPLQQVVGVQRLMRGVALTCTAGGTTARWTIEFLTRRAIATRLRPAAPGAVTHVVTSLRAAPDEHFYGLTERIADNRAVSEINPQQPVGSLDRRGTTITMAVMPTMGLYTPFFHSSRGYGAYVEGTMTGVYDLARSDPNTVTIDFEFSQRTGEHGVVYFVGDHDTILDEYTVLTGRPFLPPRWGFRHLRWRDEHRIGDPAQLDGIDMNADFVNDITMYETLGIPPGNYEFDRPWTTGDPPPPPLQEGFGSFTFDPVRFPNSDQMLAALQRRGYHTFIFIAPWALGDNAVVAEQFGYYAPRSNVLIDYTNPGAVAWWTGGVQSLIGLGITGLKLDRSEFDITELPIPPDQDIDIFADGRNGREMKNGYTVVYAKVHYDAFAQKLGNNFLNYLRAGYAGSQQYGIFWGGDSPGRTIFGMGQPTDLGLRAAILSLAHVAFMAFPVWGSDTGGYYEFGDRDVFARWLEFSAFCPLMEIGGNNDLTQNNGQHAPWDMPTEPHYDAEMIDIYRRYVTLHHELLPLFYSLAIDAHRSGRPLARPLVFDFPDDPALGGLWDEFLLGHDLLFAPLWHVGDRSRSVYLPRGTWIDYWQPATRFTGPITITADAPLDRIPLYVRTGGILPLEVSSDVSGTGSHALSDGRLTIDVYPSGASALTLHEDEGDSTFSVSDAACGDTSCVQLDLAGRQRGYVARILVESVQSVTLDGSLLTPAGSFAALGTAPSGWFYDRSATRLWVKFTTSGATARVVAARETGVQESEVES